jgi:hypothetical protein
VNGGRPPASDLRDWGRIASILRGGTIVAVVAVGLGLAWAAVAPGPAATDRSVVELIAAGGPDALISIGLLTLTLVPIAALIAAAWAFSRSGEGRAVAVTVLGLVLLVASLVVSAALGSAG